MLWTDPPCDEVRYNAGDAGPDENAEGRAPTIANIIHSPDNLKVTLAMMTIATHTTTQQIGQM